MKKIIIMLAIAISSLTAFAGIAFGKPMAAAGEENVSATVLNSFNKEFKGAKDVQ